MRHFVMPLTGGEDEADEIDGPELFIDGSSFTNVTKSDASIPWLMAKDHNPAIENQKHKTTKGFSFVLCHDVCGDVLFVLMQVG